MATDRRELLAFYANVKYWADPEAAARKIREYNKTHPEMIKKVNRKSKLKREYGLTLEEYDHMLLSQGGVCKVCKGPPLAKDNTYHVDHDHVSGKVRGILCHPCNVAIGNALESPERLRKLADYLEGK